MPVLATPGCTLGGCTFEEYLPLKIFTLAKRVVLCLGCLGVKYFRVLRERSSAPLCRRRGSFFMEYSIPARIPKKTLVERRKVLRLIVLDHGLGVEWELETLIQIVEDKRSSPSLRFDALTAVQSILAEYAPETTLGSRVKALIRHDSRRPLSAVPDEPVVVPDGGLSKSERARVDQGILDEAERVF